MAVLIINELVKNELIHHRVLVPTSSSCYAIYVPGMNGKTIVIPVEINEVKASPSVVAQVLSGLHGTSSYLTDDELRKVYDLFVQAFPASDRWEDFPETRPRLRSDPGDKGFSLFSSLVRNRNIDAYDIVAAVHYELYVRKDASRKAGRNELTYMKGLQSWLNDAMAIEGLISSMRTNQEFIDHFTTGMSNAPSRFIDL